MFGSFLLRRSRFEVFVEEGLTWCYAHAGVLLEHLAHQVLSLRLQAIHANSTLLVPLMLDIVGKQLLVMILKWNDFAEHEVEEHAG